MDTLHNILTSLTPEREYRVKFAFEPTAQNLSIITSRLNDRYDATKIGPVVKTIFQANPIDFPDLDCGETWYFDFTCSRPVSPHVLRYEISSMLQVIEQYVVVRSLMEPFEQELEAEDDIDFDEYLPKLLDSEYTDERKIDINEYSGQERADKAVEDAIKEYKKEPSVYSKYMAAGFKKD